MVQDVKLSTLPAGRQVEDASSNLVRITGFVGVTANITDCRSVATGSTPVRTAINIGL